MKKSMLCAVLIALAATSMSATAYNPPGFPVCNAANLGEGYIKYFGAGYSKEYICQESGWELLYMCTPDGCYVP